MRVWRQQDSRWATGTYYGIRSTIYDQIAHRIRGPVDKVARSTVVGGMVVWLEFIVGSRSPPEGPETHKITVYSANMKILYFVNSQD